MRSAATIALVTATGLGLALAAALAAAQDGGQPQRAEPDAEALFTQRCASCHAVPDPELRTDLAWLDQVNRTS